MDTRPLFLVLIYYPRSGNACFRQHYFKQRAPVFKQTNQSVLTKQKRKKGKKERKNRKNSNRKETDGENRNVKRAAR